MIIWLHKSKHLVVYNQLENFLPTKVTIFVMKEIGGEIKTWKLYKFVWLSV